MRHSGPPDRPVASKIMVFAATRLWPQRSAETRSLLIYNQPRTQRKTPSYLVLDTQSQQKCPCPSLTCATVRIPRSPPRPAISNIPNPSSPSGKVGPESLENHPRDHAVRQHRLGLVGPSRGGSDQAHQVRVRPPGYMSISRDSC